MKKKHVILGIHIQDRAKDAVKVQKVLSENGCIIKTRLGLHEISEDFCAMGGVVLLELVGDDKACNALQQALTGMSGVEVKKMVFTHR